MAAVDFGAVGVGGSTVTFSWNPSWPLGPVDLSPLLVPARAADGTLKVFQRGRVADLDLTWPDALPLKASDFAAFRAHYRGAGGGELSWTYTHHDGTTHTAYYRAEPSFRQVAKGFAGAIPIRVID